MTPHADLLPLGFLLGLKHALDADHLAAVATIVARTRGLRRAGSIGALWGLGHTAALLAFGLILAVTGRRLPPAWENVAELAVAAMLAGLGINVLYRLWRGHALHGHTHRHGSLVHAHPHFHAHGHRAVDDTGTGHHHSIGLKPAAVGLVHGVAGSGALMLLAAASIPDAAARLAFIGLFGAGSIIGMAAMSVLIGAPVAAAARRSGSLLLALRAGSGLLSLAVSAAMFWVHLQPA